MSTETKLITVAGIPVEIVRKDIKNFHLGVYPPQGRVRVAVPLVVNDEAVRLAVIRKLGWIKDQRQHFQEQARQTPREMVQGESHYFLGHRYRLRILEGLNPGSVRVKGLSILELQVPPGASTEQKSELLNTWYRDQLKKRIPPLLEKWEPILGVSVTDWGVRTMKTKWGSCNTQARRIWLNLELIKKPPECLEYILVHELVHLLERNHNDHFRILMDTHLPGWETSRKILNSLPLGHEDWEF